MYVLLFVECVCLFIGVCFPFVCTMCESILEANFMVEDPNTF
jgi:hypothetical protein